MTDTGSTDSASGSDESVPDQSEQLDLDPGEMLVSSGRDDMLDGGYEVPDHWSAAQGFGNTPEEQAEGETLDQRLAQEVPDIGQVAPGVIEPPTVGTDAIDSDVTELDLVGQEDLDNVTEDVHEPLPGGPFDDTVGLSPFDAEQDEDDDLDEESTGSLFAGTENIDDGEVGDEQVTRLVDPNEGTGEDDEKDLVGLDAEDSEEQSAEEAAIHLVPES
jgi:hypothetical protein